MSKDACACNSGYQGANGASCISCLGGKYKGIPGEVCASCMAGKYSEATASECTDCARGKYSRAASGICSNCEVGKFAGAAAATCSLCGAGKYAEAAASECTDCARGKYSRAASGICSNCEVGKFAGAAAATCSLCGAGKYAEAAASECTDCISGKYSRAASGNCSDCAAGKYSSLSAAGACTNCPVNSDSNAGARICSCKPGFSGPNGGECEPCTVGKYKTDAGSSQCTACPDGGTSPAGSSKLVDCVAVMPSSQTSTVITIVLSLPLSPADFDVQKQTAFKQAIANAAAVDASKVKISIEPLRRRQLLAAGIRVTIQIEVEDASRVESVKGRLSAANINSELDKAGLPAAEIVSAPTSGVLSAPGKDDGASGGGVPGGMIAGVVGGIGAVLAASAAVFVWYRKKTSQNESDKYTQPEASPEASFTGERRPGAIGRYHGDVSQRRDGSSGQADSFGTADGTTDVGSARTPNVVNKATDQKAIVGDFEGVAEAQSGTALEEVFIQTTEEASHKARSHQQKVAVIASQITDGDGFVSSEAKRKIRELIEESGLSAAAVTANVGLLQKRVMEPPTSVQEAAGAGFDTQPILAGDDDIEGSPASSNTPRAGGAASPHLPKLRERI